MSQPWRALAAAGLAVAILQLPACTTAGSRASSSPASTVASEAATPSGSSAPTLTLSPSASAPAAGGVIVTFRVADAEEYHVLLTDPEDIAVAERLLAGEQESRRIPSGVVVRDGDGGVNTGYSWHIDPESVEFAEVTIELCDGRPSYVEDGTLTGERFCPWLAEVIAIEPAG